MERQESRSSEAGRVPTALRRIPRLLLYFAVPLATLVVFVQMLRPRAYHDPAPRGSPEWWFEPLEWNLPALLPEIRGDINTVAVQPGTNPTRVWIAGDAGLLAYTEDRGRNWTLLSYDPTNGEFRLKDAPVGPTPQQPTQTQAPTPRRSVPAKKPAARKPAPQSQTRPQQQQQQPNAPVKKLGARNALAPAFTPGKRPPDVTLTSVSWGMPRWLAVVPTVHAAEEPPKKKSPQEQAKPSSQQTNPAAQQPLNPAPIEKGASTEKGRLGVNPLAITFGGTPLGKTSGPLRVELRNQGTGNLTIQSISIEPVERDFQVKSHNCIRRGFPPGASCTVDIIFQPVYPGQRAATLVIRSDAPNSPDTVALSGTTRAEPGALTPTVTPPTRATIHWPPAQAPNLLYLKFSAPLGEILSDADTVFSGGAGTEPRWSAKYVRLAESRLQLEYQKVRDRKPAAPGYAAPGPLTAEASGPNPNELWVVGKNGIVAHSSDGKTWEPLTRSAVAEKFQGAATGNYWRFLSPWYLLVLATVPLLWLISRRTGKQVPEGPGREPGSKAAGPVKRAPSRAAPGIALKAASDSPLQPGDPDALGLGKLAAGLSLFLRNPETLPPLTIGVNGKWGSGKSSLMNLLKEDLRRHGTRPVWFNAWHHQKEEQLLAALLETVRLEAVPPWWVWAWPPWGGITFRAGLLLRRLANRKLAIIVTMFVIAVVAGAEHQLRQNGEELFAEIYRIVRTPVAGPSPDRGTVVRNIETAASQASRIASEKATNTSLRADTTKLEAQIEELQRQLKELDQVHPAEAKPLQEPVGELVEGARQLAEALKPSEKEESRAESLLALASLFDKVAGRAKNAGKAPTEPSDVLARGFPWLTTLAGLLLVLTKLSQFLTAFGANPAALLHAANPGKSVKDLEAQANFRTRFAREFCEVTQSLGKKRRMLVLIDDLDRCRPEKVREVLEAVNFLSSNGECYLVLGMDREIVEHCVGLSFSKVVDSMPRERLGLAPRNNHAAAAGASSTKPSNAGDESEEELKDKYEKRTEFARQYLKKLVQIEVNIPVPDTEQQKALFAEEDPREHLPEQKNREKELEKKARERIALVRNVAGVAAPRAMTAALIIGVAFSGWMAVGPPLARWAHSIESPTPSQDASGAGSTESSAQQGPGGTETSSGANAVTTGTGGTSTSGGASPAGGTQATNPGPKAAAVAPGVVSPNATRRSWAVELAADALLMVLLLVSLGYAIEFVLQEPPESRAQDTKEFRTALAQWHPLVMKRENTPRAAKRFQNRVRYLAMRERGQKTPTPPLWERWVRRSVGAAEAPAAPEARVEIVPDSLLVALAALDEYSLDEKKDSWVRNGERFSQMTSTWRSWPGPQTTARTDAEAVAFMQALPTQWAEAPLDFAALEKARARFLELSADIAPSPTPPAPNSPRQETPRPQ